MVDSFSRIPQLGSHNRLVNEEAELIAENNHRIQATANVLYQQIDNRDFQHIVGLRDSSTALDVHAKTLEKIPTWLREADTARTVITAILFPVIVFMLQFVLQRFLR